MNANRVEVTMSITSQADQGIRTRYGLHWWLSDNTDFREIDNLMSFEEATTKAIELSNAGKGYHSFIIYAYHEQLLDAPFWEHGQVQARKRWQKVDDDFAAEYIWAIEGNSA